MSRSWEVPPRRKACPRAITEFARMANGGLIVPGDSLANDHRELIIGLAVRHKLPAIYSDRIFVIAGGLVSYGPDRIDQYRRAAEYIDRILKGEKPADLPVQAPTKYELVINFKTAKAPGLTVPPSALARADEVVDKRRQSPLLAQSGHSNRRRRCSLSEVNRLRALFERDGKSLH